MKFQFKNKIFTILCIPLLLISCSSDLDFNQVDDLKLEPVFVGNLVYFGVPANQFIDNGAELAIAFDAQGFDVFKNKFFKDNLIKAEFNFEITNTINRAFTISLILLDKNDQVLETLKYDAPANSGEITPLKFKEIFENQRLEVLKQTVQLAFLINLKSGPPLNENTLGSLKLRSSATIYTEIK